MTPVYNAAPVRMKAQGLEELSRAHQGFLTGQLVAAEVERTRLGVSYAAEDH